MFQAVGTLLYQIQEEARYSNKQGSILLLLYLLGGAVFHLTVLLILSS